MHLLIEHCERYVSYCLATGEPSVSDIAEDEIEMPLVNTPAEEIDDEKQASFERWLFGSEAVLQMQADASIRFNNTTQAHSCDISQTYKH